MPLPSPTLHTHQVVPHSGGVTGKPLSLPPPRGLFWSGWPVVCTLASCPVRARVVWAAPRMALRTCLFVPKALLG